MACAEEQDLAAMLTSPDPTTVEVIRLNKALADQECLAAH
jgi:hypothetical protein